MLKHKRKRPRSVKEEQDSMTCSYGYNEAIRPSPTETKTNGLGFYDTLKKENKNMKFDSLKSIFDGT